MSCNRIVSLLPSATEIVCALGLEDRLVGISHSCDYPPSIAELPRLSKPRANLEGLSSGEIDGAVRAALRDHGSVYELDVSAIAALDPDLVLTQGMCDVCAVPERKVVEALELENTRILRLDAHDINAILGGIRDVGCATGAEQVAEKCIGQIRDRIDGVCARVAGTPRPPVLALEWLDPPYVPGHWVPEMVALAGGDLVAGVAGRPSFRVQWTELEGFDPDIVLIMPCGFNLEQSHAELAHVATLIRDVAPRAFGAGRVYALDASAYFSRSGPRFVDGLEILAETIFPA